MSARSSSKEKTDVNRTQISRLKEFPKEVGEKRKHE